MSAETEGSAYISDELEHRFDEECECVREASDALVIRWEDGTEELVPSSVVRYASEVLDPGSRGLLTVKLWWAKKGDRIEVERRRRRSREQPMTGELLGAWRTAAQTRPEEPLSPVVLRLLHLVDSVARQLLAEREGRPRSLEATPVGTEAPTPGTR